MKGCVSAEVPTTLAPDEQQAPAGARLASTSLLHLRNATGATAMQVTSRRGTATRTRRIAQAPRERSVLRSNAKYLGEARSLAFNVAGRTSACHATIGPAQGASVRDPGHTTICGNAPRVRYGSAHALKRTSPSSSIHGAETARFRHRHPIEANAADRYCAIHSRVDRNTPGPGHPRPPASGARLNRRGRGARPGRHRALLVCLLRETERGGGAQCWAMAGDRPRQLGPRWVACSSGGPQFGAAQLYRADIVRNSDAQNSPIIAVSRLAATRGASRRPSPKVANAAIPAIAPAAGKR
jgi:hypothetical protein